MRHFRCTLVRVHCACSNPRSLRRNTKISLVEFQRCSRSACTRIYYLQVAEEGNSTKFIARSDIGIEHRVPMAASRLGLLGLPNEVPVPALSSHRAPAAALCLSPCQRHGQSFCSPQGAGKALQPASYWSACCTCVPFESIRCSVAQRIPPTAHLLQSRR